MNRSMLLMVTCSATLLVFGLWIPFKALVAQEMLELAWAESQARQTQARPWPWADTWPVAKLDIPGQGVSMIVLEGVHGESLAFGPGRASGTDRAGAPVILAGHRDTHFRHLQHMEPGDPVRLQGVDRRWRDYEVTSTRIVDSSRESLDTQELGQDTLVMITCYPFDSLDAGGPLRYVVEARPAYGQEQIDTVAAL
ncbi:class GN sortase [Marinobacter daepoensis]|uniref:class GN sortase n=1 Tax=Marinobacter daepoensis TaxID=262077 RepID=UPI0003FC7EA6|nr:class GN sortase [Marinobacter daepoensis]